MVTYLQQMIKVEINQKYRTGFIPHWGVTDVAITEKLAIEIKLWLNARNITQYDWPSYTSLDRAPIIFFENEKDAIMFKMVWN